MNRFIETVEKRSQVLELKESLQAKTTSIENNKFALVKGEDSNGA